MQDLPVSPQELAALMKLAGTPQGKQLIAMLKQEQGGAIEKALKCGDYGYVKAIGKEFAARPEVQSILKQLEGGNGRF